MLVSNIRCNINFHSKICQFDFCTFLRCSDVLLSRWVTYKLKVFSTQEENRENRYRAGKGNEMA